MPKFSIITINYNNAEGLRKTIESVINQIFQDFEYIVIDGGSTDGSKEVIEQYQDKITYWVSEPDKGVYHAMNKGTTEVKGDYVIYMNSGDVFFDNEVLRAVIPQLEDYDIVYGDLMIVEKNRIWRKYYNQHLSFFYFTYDTLPHQGSFIKLSLLKDELGDPYSEELKICSDWKFFMDAVCKRSASTKYLGMPITYYDYSGLSSVMENRDILLKEKDMVLSSEYKAYYDDAKFYKKLRQESHKLNSRFVKLYFSLRSIFKR